MGRQAMAGKTKMSGHLKTDELVNRLYGLEGHGGEQKAHLASCLACRARWEEMRIIRGVVSTPETVSSDFLAAQRRKIYARLGEEPRTRMAWAPALAAVALLAIGVAVYRPLSAPGFPHSGNHDSRAAQTDAGDAQLFSEVYSMEQSMEPSVAAPIHTLFEDNQ
jgi:hypothetical protein